MYTPLKIFAAYDYKEVHSFAIFFTGSFKSRKFLLSNAFCRMASSIFLLVNFFKLRIVSAVKIGTAESNEVNMITLPIAIGTSHYIIINPFSC